MKHLVSEILSNAKPAFYAKSWYLYVGAIVFTMLALFCAIFGPLFLFDIMKSADGKYPMIHLSWSEEMSSSTTMFSKVFFVSLPKSRHKNVFAPNDSLVI